MFMLFFGFFLKDLKKKRLDIEYPDVPCDCESSNDCNHENGDGHGLIPENP